jgi:hypothetical protein
MKHKVNKTGHELDLYLGRYWSREKGKVTRFQVSTDIGKKGGDILVEVY